MDEAAHDSAGTVDEGHAWVLVHRPERSFPVMPAPASYPLPAPPAAQEPDQTSWWASVLPMLASLSAVAYAVALHNVAYLALSSAGVLASVGGGLVARRSARRRADRRHARDHAAYARAVAELAARAADAADVQRAALEGMYPPPHELLRVVRDEAALWERRRSDADFGAVRLGVGRVPARVVLTVGQPGAGDAGSDDAGALGRAAVRATQHLAAAPVVLSLAGLASVAVVGDLAVTRPLVGSWLAQLAAFHDPTEVRLLGLVPAPAGWDWCKWLPHTELTGGGPPGAARTFTTDPRLFEELLTAEVGPRARRENREHPAGGGPGPLHAEPWLVVLVDEYRPDARVAAMAAVVSALSHGSELGVTVVALCADESRVPAACSARVDLEPDGTCTVRPSGADPEVVSGVLPDLVDAAPATRLGRWLAGRRPSTISAAGPGRPSSAAEVDPVRLRPLLAERPGRDLLAVPIGVQADGTALVLDLKEAAAGGAGPHGILVGATGSGKSELLRSLVAGLAATHPPSTVTTLLVDFKGGAAFDGLAGLPHTAGVVTNLADHPELVDRARLALVGELERRQRVLRSAGQPSIGAYRDAARSKPLDPLPYLVVVVDEFGELLSAQPEFLDVLGQVGRLGRSLGVHLLLASQRLEEGRLRGLDSHLRYRIGLRTFTAAESRAVLGSAVAHDLPPVPGVGYLQVDGSLVRFRAAIAGLAPDRASAADLPLVTPFTIGGEYGTATGATPTEGPAPATGRTDLDDLVDEVLARGEAPARPVWTPPLPSDLALPWPGASDPGPRQVPLPLAIGLVDEPARQRQVPFVVDLRGDGHVALVGGPRSGRTTFLATLVRGLAALHDPDELHVYVIGADPAALGGLERLPQVGAVAPRDDRPAVERVLDELSRLAASGSRDGAAVLLAVDDLGRLRGELPEVDAALTALATAARARRIHLALTASRWLDLRPALLDAVASRFELRLAEPAESQVGRALAAAVPAVPGRGLTRDGRPLQLARAGEGHPVRRGFGGRRAPRIAPLPLRCTEPPTGDASEAFALGIEEFQHRAVELDLARPGQHLLVYGEPASGRSTLLARVARWLASASRPADVRLHLVDPAGTHRAMADHPRTAAYAGDDDAVLALAVALDEALQRRRGQRTRPGTGPLHVLVVDDFDRLGGPDGSPLAPLADVIGRPGEVGLTVVLARRVAGATRTAYEPFTHRLRELAAATLVLSGDRHEGRLVGDVAAQAQPPGRGLLVRGGQPTVLVQTYLPAGS